MKLQKTSITIISTLFVFSVFLTTVGLISGTFPLSNILIWLLEITIFIFLFRFYLHSKYFSHSSGQGLKQILAGLGIGYFSGILTTVIFVTTFMIIGKLKDASVDTPLLSILIMQMIFGAYGSLMGVISAGIIIPSIKNHSFKNIPTSVISSLLGIIVIAALAIRFNMGPRNHLQKNLDGLQDVIIELDRNGARPINNEGMAALKAEQYQLALAKFQQALQMDPDYANAQYNAACAMSIMLSKKPCPDFTEADVIAALKRSLELAPRKKAKLLTDPDLKNIRKNFEFWKLTGVNFRMPIGFDRILSEVDWMGPLSKNRKYYVSGLNFSEDNNFVLWVRHNKIDSPEKIALYHGTYIIEKKQITLSFSEPYKSIKAAVIQTSDDGVLTSAALPGPFIGKKIICEEINTHPS